MHASRRQQRHIGATPPHAAFCTCVTDRCCAGHVQNGQEHEVDAVLRRKFEGRIRDIEIVEREDLDLVRCRHRCSC